MTVQRFVDFLRTQFDASMMDVDSINYFGIPDEENKYRVQFNFAETHYSRSGVEGFVEDVADELSSGIQYEVLSVQRQTPSEYVFIMRIGA